MGFGTASISSPWATRAADLGELVSRGTTPIDARETYMAGPAAVWQAVGLGRSVSAKRLWKFHPMSRLGGQFRPAVTFLQLHFIAFVYRSFLSIGRLVVFGLRRPRRPICDGHVITSGIGGGIRDAAGRRRVASDAAAAPADAGQTDPKTDAAITGHCPNGAGAADGGDEPSKKEW